MPELVQEPAQTYQFNVLASALGRFAPPEIDDATVSQSAAMLDDVVEAISSESKPVVPHTNKVLLEVALAFDDKLSNQLVKGKAASYLSRTAIQATSDLIRKHQEECSEMLAKHAPTEMLVEPTTIAASYGLPDLWVGADMLIREEVEKWSHFKTHPEIPADLRAPVTQGETLEMMRLMWEHVVGTSEYPQVNVYLTDRSLQYHVYWSPLADTLDYATPATYDRATQLSYDLPHNATHLAHLQAMQSDRGVFRYNDCMAQRAYFEAVTVLSEWEALRQAKSNAAFIEGMHTILNPKHMTQESLADWMVRDRGYEFKLRVARYAADVMMLAGESYADTTHEVSQMLDIPLDDTGREIKKYIAWTGLGAVYLFGYRKLLSFGIDNVRSAMSNESGTAITSWGQLNPLQKS